VTALTAEQALQNALSLHRGGRMAEAERLYRLVLEAEARSRSGLGRADPAVVDTLIALGVATRTRACLGLGDVYLDQGRGDDALGLYRHAVQIAPDQAAGHFKLGFALARTGDAPAAFDCFRRAAKLDRENLEYWRRLGRSIAQVRFRASDDDLLDVLGEVLTRRCVAPDTVSAAILGALIVHPGFPSPDQEGADFGAMAARFAGFPLLRSVMVEAPVNIAPVEGLLTRLRRSLLATAAAGGIDDSHLALAAALAAQCFINEYVFSVTAAEDAELVTLQARVSSLLKDGARVPALWIAALGCYIPLHALAGRDVVMARDWPEEIGTLLRMQVVEPLAEQALKSGIPVLTVIDDRVSMAVRGQYEQNPYPRWVRLCLEPRPMSLNKRMAREMPELDLRGQVCPEHPDVLIAGCGSGRHSILASSQLAGSRVLAVDLSLSSLAYARRKSDEMGISNIEYGQADILRLRELGRSFDHVESFGVLHHMENPLEGWRALVDVLRPGGTMRISLYVDTLRQSVVKARSLVAAERYESTDTDIRRCRDRIRAMAAQGDSDMDSVVAEPDFYSLSNCRDLIFHVQEHVFSLAEIERAISALGLRFLGFEGVGADLKRRFRKAYPDPAHLSSLSHWRRFEKRNPGSFAHPFWCRKP
jgi:2-polyprenyl-3-methyl-5-hydroxy-6-metoxy-1,4-benzoquinol methylase/tetratricopeptide (TPR) repeat protein